MKIIGITGSIGSGKSFVASMFEENGAVVFDADKEVRQIYQKSEIIDKLQKEFPDVVISGKIDRKKLATKILSNDDALKTLESIIHPIVRAREEIFLEKGLSSNKKLVILDIPLLYETGADMLCDKVILTHAPKYICLNRVLERDNMNKELFEKIFSIQNRISDKKGRADYVINTDVNKDKLREDILNIMKELR